MKESNPYLPTSFDLLPNLTEEMKEPL